MSPVTKQYGFRNKQTQCCQPSTTQVLKPACHLHQVKRDSELRQLLSMKNVCGQILPFCLQSQRCPSVLWQTSSALRWGNFSTFCPKNGNCFVCCYEAVQITWPKDKVHGVYTSHHMLQQLSLSAEPSYSRRSTRKMGNQDLGRNEDFSYACCGKACTAMALHTVQLLTPLTKAPARHIWISGLLFGLSSQSLPHRLTKIFITQSMCVMGGSLLHTLVNMKLFFVVWFSSQMCQSCNGDWCFLCWASRLSSWAALDL